MAEVKTLKEVQMGNTKHTLANCTYSIIETESGTCLQIDTYGSNTRQEKDKKSQSIRFTQGAIVELKAILKKEFK